MSNYLPGQVLNPDYLLGVSLGNVLGANGLNIPGHKDNVSSTVFDDITQIPGTTVTPDPGGIQLALKSSNAADTLAGTGIQTVRISYLDSNCLQLYEDVDLNGLALVNTVSTDMNLIQGMYAIAVGSAAIAVGGISLMNVGDTIAYEYIEAGGNRSLSSRYHVPMGKTAFIIGWDASSAGQEIDFRLRSNVDPDDRKHVHPGIFLFQDAKTLKDSASGYNPFMIPIECPETSSIKISGKSIGAGGDCGVSFDLLILTN